MKLTLRIHRQDGPDAPSRVEEHTLEDLSPRMSLLDVLDLLNTRLLEEGQDPVAVEYDCREGVCGACGITVDGRPHGPESGTPTCHQRLTSFADGDTVELQPFRAGAFPVLRDLVVDRSVLDRIVAAGGHVGTDVGAAPDADALPVTPQDGERALDLAACIGCGACIAACPNAAGHLFLGAKLSHLAALPTSRRERSRRARAMVAAADRELGGCSLYGECARVCPAGIDLGAVAAVNRERARAWLRPGRDD